MIQLKAIWLISASNGLDGAESEAKKHALQYTRHAYGTIDVL